MRWNEVNATRMQKARTPHADDVDSRDSRDPRRVIMRYSKFRHTGTGPSSSLALGNSSSSHTIRATFTIYIHSTGDLCRHDVRFALINAQAHLRVAVDYVSRHCSRCSSYQLNVFHQLFLFIIIIVIIVCRYRSSFAG